MRVICRWPALVPAIRRAGHEPVVPFDVEDNVPSMSEAVPPAEADLPSPPLTARPRGAQRYPR